MALSRECCNNMLHVLPDETGYMVHTVYYSLKKIGMSGAGDFLELRALAAPAENSDSISSTHMAT